MDGFAVRLATFSCALYSASRRAAYPPLFGRSTASHIGEYGLFRLRQAVLLVAPAGLLALFRGGHTAQPWHSAMLSSFTSPPYGGT